MRVIIAGSRHFRDQAVLNAAMDVADACGIVPTLVLSGCAQGVDRMGERWAEHRHRNPRPAVERHPAEWEKHGKAAGPMRNSEMVNNADALVALWDGESSGTADILRKARVRGLRIVCVTVQV